MNNELLPAIVVLQKKLEGQLLEVSETKKLINMLLKTMGKPPLFEEESGFSGAIRADQFYGKQLATAAAEYLEMRKQACQPIDILQGLQDGGYDFEVMGWKKGDELRMLALSLAKNNLKFHKLKNGSFGLKAWYDEDFLKKAGKQKAANAAAAATMDAADEQEAADNFTPKVGDYVQWEPGGVMQFTEPREIARISEDGVYAFIAASDTGMPVEELVLHAKPKPGKSSAK
jgi:hypothetical protein